MLNTQFTNSTLQVLIISYDIEWTDLVCFGEFALGYNCGC